MSTPSLELRGIRKSYQTASKPHVVLDDIDFTLKRGERLGVCGLNGAGKTTLVNIIAGALTPDAGKVVRHSRMSWPLGYSGGFHSALTGLENARFIARIYGRRTEEVAAFVKDFAELGKFFEMPIRTYSSGMRSRLAFAVSMAIDFELYLIDEVMSAGDLRFHEKCRQAIEERRDRADFLIVSHSIGTIEENCNRYALLHGGKLVVFDELETAQAAYSEVFTRGQKIRPVEWKLDIAGAVEARLANVASDSVDVVIDAHGPGSLIAYWGKTTELIAQQNDTIAVECPVQAISGGAAGVVSEWTGLQFVERDRVGGAVLSDVLSREFLGGMPEIITAQTLIAKADTRFFQMGVRIEFGGGGALVLRLGRPFIDRNAAPVNN